MSSDSGTPRLPRRLRWYLPAIGVLVVTIPAMVALGVAQYLLLATVLGVGYIPGVRPMLAVVIGLVAGACATAAEWWRTMRQLEVEARALAFGERSWKLWLSRIAPFLGGVFVVLGALHLLMGPYAGVMSPLALGAMMAPYLLIHSAATRVYNRGVELLRESPQVPESERAAALVAPSARPKRWVTTAAISIMVGALALGAWLHWIVPALAVREPRSYALEQEAGGPAMRLTYSADAGAPAGSPDGRLVAYVRAGGLLPNRLEVMRPDGSGKRRVGAESGMSPDLAGSLAWSPDGARILVLGTQAPPTIDVRKPPPEESPDLWIVNVATGDARRLTTNGGFVAAAWLPGAGKVAGLRYTEKSRGRLWLMDERGGAPHEVRGLTVRASYHGLQPRRDGREVVVVGPRDSGGIWSVDGRSGQTTRLSDLKCRWALPLDSRRLVIAVGGTASPRGDAATSVGILDTASGGIRWVLRDIQGSARSPRLVPGAPVVVFFLLRDDNRPRLYALHLRDGRMRKLADGSFGSDISVAPSGREIFFVRSEDNISVTSRITDLFGWSVWRLELSPPLASW